MNSSGIDTVKLIYHCPHSPRGDIKGHYPNGTPMRKRISLRNCYGDRGLQFMSLKGGEYFSLEGSLIKFLTGQNIFSTEDLSLLAERAFDQVTEKLGIEVPNRIRKRVAQGKVQIQRLDIFAHADLDSDYQVRQAQQALKLLWSHSHWDFSSYGLETLYIGQHSDMWTFKSYIKFLELLSKCLPRALPYRDMLYEVTKQLLRFELTLHGRLLKKINRVEVCDWTAKEVRKQIQRAVRKIVPDNSVPFPQVPAHPQLSRLQNLMVAAHARNLSTLTIGSKRWWNDQRRKIRKTARIDIAVPWTVHETSQDHCDLRQLKTGIGYGYPDWAEHAGLVPVLGNQ